MKHILLLCLLFGMMACSDASGPDEPRRPDREIPFRKDGTLTFVRSDGSEAVTIDIEIAETDSARSRGLMDRSSLPPNSGMLFIFNREEPRSFWMANTYLSLDMIFVDADSGIVNIEKYIKPLSPDNTTSTGPAQYVVEVPAGFTDSHGLNESDRVRWSHIPK